MFFNSEKQKRYSNVPIIIFKWCAYRPFPLFLCVSESRQLQFCLPSSRPMPFQPPGCTSLELAASVYGSGYMRMARLLDDATFIATHQQSKDGARIHARSIRDLPWELGNRTKRYKFIFFLSGGCRVQSFPLLETRNQ